MTGLLDLWEMNPLVLFVIAINLLPAVGLVGALVYTVYWALVDARPKKVANPYWSVCDARTEEGPAKSVQIRIRGEKLIARLKAEREAAEREAALANRMEDGRRERTIVPIAIKLQ